jgi:hypothetical protein
MSVADRALRALVARRVRERGRLVYVDRDGSVVDLGAFAPRDLASLAWAHRVAYRMTRERDERARLASSRDAAARLAREASRLESNERSNTTR